MKNKLSEEKKDILFLLWQIIVAMFLIIGAVAVVGFIVIMLSKLITG